MELFHASRRWTRWVGCALVAVLISAGLAGAQDLESFKQRTTVHRLGNGWTFIIVERPEAPVFSYATLANVGSAQEVPGITGLAHMFEHMAFKGTPNIGTKDYAAEKKALNEEEAAYQAWQAERLKAHPDKEALDTLEKAFREKQKEAAQYVVANEFDEILSRQGGVGLNAFTNADETGYFFSLPSNKFELFAFLESERFLHPVFREFYKERAVVQEERRMRTESQPIGRLVEAFTSAAFTAHPYHHPVVGYMSDLQSITITDARAFFNRYYGPANLVTAIVGDVKAADVIPIIDEYFGRIPARPAPEPLRTVEPPQAAEREVVLRDPAQPFYLEGYHKPADTGADQPVYDAIDDILSNGRTSRLYRSLVRDKKIAVATQSLTGYPGQKYPNLWVVYAVPAKGHTDQEVADAIHAEIDRLKTEDVTDAELEKFKTRAKARLLRSLDNNQGLAFQLAEYQRLYGDWQELFRYLDRLDKVTKADIRRVANETFTESNRTVGMIVTESPSSSSDDGSAKTSGEEG